MSKTLDDLIKNVLGYWDDSKHQYQKCVSSRLIQLIPLNIFVIIGYGIKKREQVQSDPSV
jgi:hypothetical protein